jgi:glyoxylase-like metal-dependent hydrolase (beta-lactamase superfamily II)
MNKTLNRLAGDKLDFQRLSEAAHNPNLSLLLTKALGLASLKDHEVLPSRAMRRISYHSSMYLIPMYEHGNDFIMIDAGASKKTPLEDLSTFVQNDTEPANIHAVLVTHPHSDHTAGLHSLSQDVPVFISPEDKPVLQGKRPSEGLIPSMLDKLTQQRLAAAPNSNMVAINAGNVLKYGDVAVEVFEMPGHTRGSLAYLVSREGGAADLFVGDGLDYRHDGSVVNAAARPFTADRLESGRSIVRLASFITRNNIEVSSVVPAHSGSGSIEAMAAY